MMMFSCLFSFNSVPLQQAGRQPNEGRTDMILRIIFIAFPLAVSGIYSSLSSSKTQRYELVNFCVTACVVCAMTMLDWFGRHAETVATCFILLYSLS